MHLHINRGKRSIVLDLRTDEGVETFLELVARRRRGRRGDAARRPRAPRPRLRASCARSTRAIVFCTISGYGMTGPYKDMPSHGIAYDMWAGIVQPEVRRRRLRVHARARVDRHQRRSAVRRARHARRRHPGPRRRARAASSRSRSPTRPPRSTGCAARRGKAYERPESEVTGNEADNYERRAPGTAGMKRRRALPVLRRPPTATCCSWRRSASSGRTSAKASAGPTCSSAGPGSQYADHARGNTRAARRSCATSSRRRRRPSGSSSATKHNTPIAPVEHAEDASPTTRSSRTACRGSRSERLGADQLPTPIKFVDETLPDARRRRPTVGQHTDEVLRDVLGYDDATASMGPASDGPSGAAS